MIAGIIKVFDLFQGPRLFQFFWHFLSNVSRLTGSEIQSASLVLGEGSIRYHSVRVAEGRLLSLIFRFNEGRAFTTFRTINLPRTGGHSREHVELLIHELVHVYQFETVGSIYIYEALRAQQTEGYLYGHWPQLAIDRENGMHFKDYNREQQGQIAQDYQIQVIGEHLSSDEPVSMAFEPFIAELKDGQL